MRPVWHNLKIQVSLFRLLGMGQNRAKPTHLLHGAGIPTFSPTKSPSLYVNTPWFANELNVITSLTRFSVEVSEGFRHQGKPSSPGTWSQERLQLFFLRADKVGDALGGALDVEFLKSREFEW